MSMSHQPLAASLKLKTHEPLAGRHHRILEVWRTYMRLGVTMAGILIAFFSSPNIQWLVPTLFLLHVEKHHEAPTCK